MSLRAVLLMLMLAGPAVAQPWGQAQEAVEQWLQGTQAQTQGLTVEVPSWVEDGAFVAVDLTLHGAQPPLSLSLLRSGEEDPRIATLQLQAWEAPLRLSTRVRLPRSQQLIVLARDGRGRIWQAAQSVEVLASSCRHACQLASAACSVAKKGSMSWGFMGGDCRIDGQTLSGLHQFLCAALRLSRRSHAV